MTPYCVLRFRRSQWMRERSASAASSFALSPEPLVSTAIDFGSIALGSRYSYGKRLTVCTGPSALSRLRKSS